MNGDSKIIYDAISELKVAIATIQTKQEENHRDNKGDITVIFQKLGKLDNLPCEVHIERMANFKRALCVMGAFLSIVIPIIFSWLWHLHGGE